MRDYKIFDFFGVISPGKVARTCPFCYRKCAWFIEMKERYRERHGRSVDDRA